VDKSLYAGIIYAYRLPAEAAAQAGVHNSAAETNCVNGTVGPGFIAFFFQFRRHPVNERACAIVVDQFKYLRAIIHAQSATDACFLIYLSLHKISP